MRIRIVVRLVQARELSCTHRLKMSVFSLSFTHPQAIIYVLASELMKKSKRLRYHHRVIDALIELAPDISVRFTNSKRPCDMR